MRRGGWKEARRILCVRLDALGDVLMTTPAMAALREARSGRTITLLASKAGAEIARHVPVVDETIVYEAPWMKASPVSTGSAPDRQMVERLRDGGFDAAVIFTVYSQSPFPAALLCYLADIPLRLAHARENPYQLLTHWVKEREPGQGVRHEVRRQLALVAEVGCRTGDEHLRLAVPRTADLHVAAMLEDAGIVPHRPWAVVHPGATAPSRRWPADRFAALVRTLAVRHGWQFVLTGSAGEQPLLQSVAQMAGVPVVPLGGKLDMGELAALIARAPLLVSNNTGPVHIAAAVGTPVVVLYALTNPQHTPWRVPARVLFRDVPCRCCYRSICPQVYHRCLEGVTVEEAVHAARELYAARAAAAERTRALTDAA